MSWGHSFLNINCDVMIEFEKSYTIPVYDSDSKGRLSAFSLFNYIQDIASEHAELLHFGRGDLQRSNQFWILSRLYAEIERFPLWGETVILRTWPRGTEGLFALRDIEANSKDGGKVAGATTSWVIVDSETRRPQRPDSLLERMNLNFPDRRTTNRNAGKPGAVEQPFTESPTFIVKPSDLDVNQHVNNVKYIQWVTDTFNVSFLSDYSPKTVEVSYLSESVEGDRILIRSNEPTEENNWSLHSVIRIDDGRELCRIMISWHQAPNQKVL